MTDTDNSLLDSFLNWLFGLNDNDEVTKNLPSAAKNFRDKYKQAFQENDNKLTQGIKDAAFAKEEGKEPLIDKDLVESLHELGIDLDPKILVEYDSLSKQGLGNAYKANVRWGNIAGRASVEADDLRKAVTAYKQEQKRLDVKVIGLENQVKQIQIALYKIDQINKNLELAEKVKKGDESALTNLIESGFLPRNFDPKANPKVLTALIDGLNESKTETLSAAKGLRSADHRGTQHNAGIAAELRWTLERRNRELAALTGKGLKLSKDGTNFIETTPGEILKDKLGYIDAIDRLIEFQKKSGKNGYEIIKPSLEKLKDSKSKEVQNLIERAYNLNLEQLKANRHTAIQEAKGMRSLDHRGMLHDNGILWELKKTSERFDKKENEEKAKLTKKAEKIKKRAEALKKANEVLAQKKRTKELVSKLGALGVAQTTTRMTGNSALPSKKPQTQGHQHL